MFDKTRDWEEMARKKVNQCKWKMSNVRYLVMRPGAVLRWSNHHQMTYHFHTILVPRLYNTYKQVDLHRPLVIRQLQKSENSWLGVSMLRI
jgi:hypothetical protein